MRNFFSVIKNVLLGLYLCAALIGCSKITQSNYDKIQPQMTMQEVVSLIGEPTSSESVNIAGIAGTSATWKNRDIEIHIQFLNNQVAVKTFSKPDPNESR